MRVARWLVLAGAVLWVGSGAALAQVKPKILILFDTSGSMMKDSNEIWQDGDGSALCTNIGQQSRIYQLKAALFDTLQGIGAQEVDFGLATFPMFMDPTRDPFCALGGTACSNNNDCRPGETCTSVVGGGKVCISPCQSTPSCSGHYYTTSGSLSEYNAYNKCVSPYGEDCRYGCRVSAHNPTSQTSASCGATSNPCSAWYSAMKQEVLKVPFAGTTPEAVMIFFDQLEDTDKLNPLSNPEVRAGNGWWTPLGKSLFYTYGYFHKEVVSSILAYEKPCTNIVVAMFTDGVETCNDSYVDPSGVYGPTNWAGNLYTLGTQNNLNVVVHTIGIDIPSTGINEIQAIANAGHGTYYNVAGNTAALKAAFLDIIAKALPPSEICDGIDNDCDGSTDEDFPLKGQPCDNGLLGVCYKTGTYVCQNGGLVCNAPSASGTTEICDGLDNDCDGQIDEIPGCIPCAPEPEVCDNKDNDCDGQIDEDIASTPCGPDVGECTPGNTQCVNGQTICAGATGPQTEICDGLDNDCDGVIDGMSESCYEYDTGCVANPTSTTGWDCTGYCKPGMTTCTAGVWGNCLGQVGPGVEVCNLLDDDCDGEVDEEDDCPPDYKCVDGKCVPPCGQGEFDCPAGQICVNGYCVKDPCDPVECGKKNWICVGGVCIDPCEGKTCDGTYEKCIKGVCVDTSCYNPANKCPPGESCVQGECKKDPCADAGCSPDEYCVDGTCYPLCDDLACAPGESCKADAQGVAKCTKDPCADIDCGEGRVCKDGQCVVDPCNTVQCPDGQVCIDGTCVADPCEKVWCPQGLACREGVCVPTNVTGTTDLLATGSGGVGCTVGPPEEPSPTRHTLLLIFVAALLILVRQARRDSTRDRD
jgi:hypothetical protein